MKKFLIGIALVTTFSSQANNLLENPRVRSFLEAASKIEFCGRSCYQASNGDNVHLDEMSCEELEEVSISLNESLAAHEERLKEIRAILSRPAYRNIFVDEDELKFTGYVLNTDLIPRLKHRTIRVHEIIESKCE
ncbi:hypothetical protein [Halobacteriovorax sp. HLS]|uniref:hypothetical protein n=1 Tax=Halobacteriovorax sp. HLS TaxID=2234000 RepID=UPI000FDA43DC|nr:hypothetical protein [Halobacteriovorax sp. HLS]